DALYRLAWQRGLKTTYYLRSRSATHVEKSTLKGTDGKLNAVSAVVPAAALAASPILVAATRGVGGARMREAEAELGTAWGKAGASQEPDSATLRPTGVQELHNHSNRHHRACPAAPDWKGDSLSRDARAKRGPGS